MQGATALLEQAAVRYLVGQGVLERVLQLREQRRLVHKLGRLELGEPRAQRIVW